MSNITERLYYTDSYRTTFHAHVLERTSEGCRLVLDQTAFYPTSGGQPHDVGRIAGVEVQDVVDEEERIVHVLAGPVAADEVDSEIDWRRRFDHMQQHTGQHLLSAVLADLFGYATVSFHMGAASSTIDLACPALSLDQIQLAEARANEIVFENRPVTVTIEDANTVKDLRKATERSGPVRVVAIDDLDRSACGGTHVSTTGEIGAILLRSVDRVRGNVRLEFLCGSRAVRRARADYVALESAARVLSAPLEEVPSLIAAQAERLKETDKTRRRLETELAGYRGRALHAETAPNSGGIRFYTRVLDRGPFPEDLRAEANAFVSAGKAVYVILTKNPATVMVSSSADSGIHVGNVLKQIFSELGGKGGGSAQTAQGSFTADANTFFDRLRVLLLSDE